MRILNWILAILSAILLVLLFPGFSFAWLAPVALTPLLIACAREPNWRGRLAFGYAAGFVSWFGLCNWIQWTLEHHAGVSAITSWLLFLLFCLAKAVQMGVFAICAGPLMRRGLSLIAVPALWVTLEWTHAWTGFEWLHLGNAGSDMSLLLRIAPFTGVWGISFIFALMATIVAMSAMRPQRVASLWLLPLLLLFALPEEPAPERGGSAAAVVQPNITEDTIWSSDLIARTQERMRVLSLITITGRAPVDLVLWPEVPAPFYDFDPQLTGLLSSIAREAHAGMIAGVVARDAQAPLNSALFVSSAGVKVSRYDKVNLVPFGEFVPWPFDLVTEKVSTEVGDFAPGRGIVVSPLNSHPTGTFICYESVFPGYIRRFVASGAQVLFNLSNDSWFGKSQARYQHLQIVRMRAVENRRWIVRATNNGISAGIDPAGRVRRTLPEFEEAAGRIAFSYRNDLTLYTRLGDWFVYVCAAMAAAALAFARFREGLPSRPGSLR